MRVALVLATSTGGIGRHVRSLADGLTAAGHTVVVLGPRAVAAQFAFPSFRPVEISANPHPRDVEAVAALRAELRGFAPEVVHAHGLRAGVVAALAGRHPLVVTWHNLVLAGGLRARAYDAVERFVARRTDLALCASDDLVSRVLRRGARDARTAPVSAPALAPSTADRDKLRAALGVGAEPLVLSVGRLHPQKRHGTLVAAAAMLRDRTPTPRFVIAGSGPADGELRALIAATQAPVHLLGHRDDVADLLRAADIAVVTSTWEARQLFAQEALRAGVPLVATAVGGLPGLVGDAAQLVPAGDAAAVAAAIARLLDDPAAAARYAAAGPARAATWPSEADTVAQVAACYTELTGRP